MFMVPLGSVERGEILEVRQGLSPDDPLWEGSGLKLVGDLLVECAITATAGGQLIARGQVDAVLGGECRRCLSPVQVELHVPLDLVWMPEDELSDEEGEGADGVRTLPAGAREVDLGEAVREEVLLAAPVHVVCRETCLGICPRCGSEQLESECTCTQAEPDPRWSALRALKRD
jgi:uncharacterized protein